MNTFFIYLLKSGIWIAVFWLIYWFFLRKEIFFRFNRLFLLAGLPAALLLPLWQITYRVNLVLPIRESVLPDFSGAASVATVAHFDISTLLLWIYLSGVAIVLFRNLLGIAKIRRFISNGIVSRHERVRVVQTALVSGSFSFFNYIFINNLLQISPKEKELIVEHEKVHVLQYHWVDLLMIQLVSALQWFNPFIYLYQKSIKENQEFMADRAVLEHGNSPAFYQAVLINNTFRSPIFELTNSFTHNKLNRISIMKTTVNHPARKWASMLLIPALAIFLWISAKPAYSISFVNQAITLPANDTIKPKPLIIIDGKEYLDMAIDAITNFVNTENIDKIEVLKDKSAIDIYGEKGENGVILITTKTLLPDNKISSNDANKELNIKSLNKQENSASPIGSIQMSDDTVTIRPAVAGKRFLVLDIDGNEYDSLKNNVLFDSNDKMILKYGETTLIGSDIRYIPANDEKPLYIVDGVQLSSLQNILPKDVLSINVLKNNTAIKKYGTIGKNGVIVVTSKKAVDAKDEIVDEPQKLPEFIGEEGDLMEYLGYNLKYPKEVIAVDVNIRVFYSFIVGKDGTVRNIEFYTGHIEKDSNNPKVMEAYKLCKAEAIRIIALTSKQWKPAIDKNGAPVSYKMTLPIWFKLH
ncbi:MAG: hypothetical protein LBV31_04030 [Prevotellaceae bacterium]|jgi:TonB-dependent SusC/RagA subfamily outer membrane receptor|nr:hypothetical protein [Prevotellaceae bacterium]